MLRFLSFLLVENALQFFFFRTPATIIIAEARLILLAICGVVCRLVESLNH